jgi:RNA polymerase sigma factor (sigma-70 family)
MAADGKITQDDFERLFEEHAQPLFGFLVYRTGNRAIAEDVLADTFERALRARRRFNPRRGSEKNWLYSIALNLLRDRHRREKIEERALQSLEAIAEVEDPPVDTIANRDLIQRALEALSPEEREAIGLRYGADLTLPEIAKLIGEPLTTVEGRIYPALNKLRRQLAGGDEGEPVATSAPGRRSPVVPVSARSPAW